MYMEGFINFPAFPKVFGTGTKEINMNRRIFFISAFCFLFFAFGLFAQDTLEEIVTWELNDENAQFLCYNFNSGGSDLNNDGYDDYIHWYPGDPYKFQFFMGNVTPNTTFDFEIEVPFGSGFITWGGDLNGDGYKDMVYSVVTDWGDPGDVYICFGGEEIDLGPDLILQGEDYVPDPYGLNYLGFNGGYDFNNDGYDDLLTWGSGPSLWWNGLIQIFLGGEELSTTPDFQIQGNIGDEFGRSRAVGDINGDGYDDLIVSRYIGNIGVQFEVYLGGDMIDTIPDFITSEIYEIGNYPLINYSNGDVNNDGFDDVLISFVGVFLGNSEGILNLDYQLSGYLKYTNINYDEYDDVLQYDYDSNRLNIYYGSTNFDIIPIITIDSLNFASSDERIFCDLGDYNNNGINEILINNSNNNFFSNSATMYGLSNGNAIDNRITKSNDYKLLNYPNPFNPITTISFDLPVYIANPVIEIFNVKGEKVRELPIVSPSPAHTLSVKWDGTDNYQNQVSSGVYLYRIKTDEGISISKKMLLLK